MRRTVALVLVGVLALQGCATKRHGRALSVSAAERRHLECPAIEIELDKNRSFMTDVAKESGQVDGRAVLGILGDFGIGNALETSDAMDSARVREQQLFALAREKNCAGLAPQAQAATAGTSHTVIARAAQPSGFADVNDSSKVPASANCQKLYREQFLNAAFPRAYVLAGWQTNGTRFCFASRRPNASEVAMKMCQDHPHNAGSCKLYAVDNTVVWQAEK